MNLFADGRRAMQSVLARGLLGTCLLAPITERCSNKKLYQSPLNQESPFK